MEGRISDGYPIKVEPANDDERFIIEEAKLWLDNNIYKSSLDKDEHVNNVINLGKEKVFPFIFELLRENNHSEGMYLWFCSMIIDSLLKDEIKVGGYMPIMEWTKNILALYDNGFIKISDNNNDK